MEDGLCELKAYGESLSGDRKSQLPVAKSLAFRMTVTGSASGY